MKLITAIVVTIILGTVMVYAGDSATEKNAKTATIAQNKNDTLIVQARLIEIPGTFPPNDLYNYVYVMKYRIIKVIKGSYQEKEILVGHYNPRISRNDIKDKMDPLVGGSVKQFKTGTKQRLVLVSLEKGWNDAVETEYFDSELPVFFALTADTIQ